MCGHTCADAGAIRAWHTHCMSRYVQRGSQPRSRCPGLQQSHGGLHPCRAGASLGERTCPAFSMGLRSPPIGRRPRAGVPKRPTHRRNSQWQCRVVRRSRAGGRLRFVPDPGHCLLSPPVSPQFPAVSPNRSRRAPTPYGNLPAPAVSTLYFPTRVCLPDRLIASCSLPRSSTRTVRDTSDASSYREHAQGRGPGPSLIFE
jgi:hypothetical protein